MVECRRYGSAYLVDINTNKKYVSVERSKHLVEENKRLKKRLAELEQCRKQLNKSLDLDWLG